MSYLFFQRHSGTTIRTTIILHLLPNQAFQTVISYRRLWATLSSMVNRFWGSKIAKYPVRPAVAKNMHYLGLLTGQSRDVNSFSIKIALECIHGGPSTTKKDIQIISTFPSPWNTNVVSWIDSESFISHFIFFVNAMNKHVSLSIIPHHDYMCIPDLTFYNFRASKSVDRRILFCSKTSIDGFKSDKIFKCLIAKHVAFHYKKIKSREEKART